jgi:general stress protein 26
MNHPASAPRSADQLLAIVDEILASNPYGFLVSHAATGHTRLVHHQQEGNSCELWIGTSPRSRKVSDLRASSRVTYAVEDRTRLAYVALYADAEVVADAAVLQARWVPEFRTFFPDGALGGDFALLRLVPWRIELMSFGSSIHPEPYGLLPAALARGDLAGAWQVVPADRMHASAS